MRFLFFSALLAAAAPRLLAQNSTLTPGHLVTVSGDTLRGFVKDEDWVAGQAVEFSSSADGARKSYDLASIRSLYMEQYNEYHIAATVDIDKKPIRLDNLERTGARNIVRETVLLKLLAGGQLNLYSYKDENRKNHYFIQPEGKDIKELPYVRYFAPGGDVVNMPFYLNVLKDLTKSCIKVAIRDQAYEESPLTKIVSTFNGCFGEEKKEKKQPDGSYVKPHERMKISINVFAGGRYSGLKYDGIDYAVPGTSLSRPPGASTVDFGNAFNMTGGVNFELQPRKASNKLRLGWGFQWQQAGTFSGITAVKGGNQRQYFTKFNYITGTANFKYLIVRRETWNAYAKASLGAVYLVSCDQHAAVINTTTKEQRETDFMIYRKMGLDFAFYAGLTYKRAFVELGYQRDTMYGEVSANATTGAVVALLGYRVF